MKSHAMKARAEAEAQLNQASNSQNTQFPSSKIQPVFHHGQNIADLKRTQYEQNQLKQGHDLLGPMPQINAGFSPNRVINTGSKYFPN